MLKSRTWVAFVIICLLYWATWHRYKDNPQSHFKADLLLRHAIDYGLLLAVAFTGWIGWKPHRDQWICKLWLLVYGIVICGLTIGGLFDVISVIGNESFRSMLSGLRLFFTSPVPFGILVFFAKRSYRQTKIGQ